MSDLSATNCGCGCGCDNDNGGMFDRNNNSCLWIILLLIFCGGCGNFGGGCGSRCGSDCGNNSCLWIILLLIFCGGCGC